MEGLDVMNGGSAVMNDTFPVVHASAILTDASDAPIVPAVPRRTFIPAPLLFVIATAFGISSTFQAYWLDALSHEHPMQHAVRYLLALNLVYWYIPALLTPTIMAFALRHPIDRVRWPRQMVVSGNPRSAARRRTRSAWRMSAGRILPPTH